MATYEKIEYIPGWNYKGRPLPNRIGPLGWGEFSPLVHGKKYPMTGTISPYSIYYSELPEYRAEIQKEIDKYGYTIEDAIYGLGAEQGDDNAAGNSNMVTPVTSRQLPAPLTPEEIELQRAIQSNERDPNSPEFKPVPMPMPAAPKVKIKTAPMPMPAAPKVKIKTVPMPMPAAPRVEIKPSPPKPVLGASSTTTENIASPQTGALGNLGLTAAELKALGGQSNIASAIKLATALSPKEDPVDPWVAALLYFTEMGKQASKPGATALGAAASAGTPALAYLLKKRDAERKRKAAILPTAVSLAAAMKPKGTLKAYVGPDKKVRYLTTSQVQALSAEDQAKLTPYKSPTIKTPKHGTMARYFGTEEEAKEFVLSQGLAEDQPNFRSTVKKFIAPNEDRVGETIQSSGVFLEVAPLYQDGEVINLQMYPSKSAAAPRFQLYVEKRLPLVAKATDTYNTTSAEVLPRVQEAMDLLRTGEVPTGKLTETFLPLKQAFNQAFGTIDPEIVGQETLQATSNFLAPKMRPVGSGSTSDMEFRAYQRAILSLGNTPEANYISLYAFKKMSENAVALNQKEKELLTDDRITSASVMNKELRKIDNGIFEKYTGSRTDKEEFDKWYNSLPDGAVIINNNLFPDKPNLPYVIKNWGK
jgi:hypothetical protein